MLRSRSDRSFSSPVPDRVDFFRVRYVLQRIGRQDDEIGKLSGPKLPAVRKPEEPNHKDGILDRAAPGAINQPEPGEGDGCPRRSGAARPAALSRQTRTKARKKDPILRCMLV